MTLVHSFHASSADFQAAGPRHRPLRERRQYCNCQAREFQRSDRDNATTTRTTTAATTMAAPTATTVLRFQRFVRHSANIDRDDSYNAAQDNGRLQRSDVKRSETETLKKKWEKRKRTGRRKKWKKDKETFFARAKRGKTNSCQGERRDQKASKVKGNLQKAKETGFLSFHEKKETFSKCGER